MKFTTRATKLDGSAVELAGPDKPLHEHQAILAKLTNPQMLNEEYSDAGIYVLQPNRTVKFTTKKGLAEKAAADKAAEESLAQAKKFQAKRQAEIDNKVNAKEAAAHAVKVAELNKLHDAIRGGK